MAEPIEGMDLSARKQKYPWDQWLNGQTWKLDLGKDVAVASFTSFRSAASYQGKMRGLIVRIQVRASDGVVYVQAAPK